MGSNEFSIKDRIELISENKKKIHKSSTLIVGFYQRLDRDGEDNSDRIIFDIKQNLLTIINELNTIGGFCDKSTRDLIMKLTDVGVWFRAHNHVSGFWRIRTYIDYWTSKSIGLPLDYSSYPFKIKGGFEINWRMFKGYIKGEYERPSFPGGRIGGIITVITIVVFIVYLLFFYKG